MLLGGPVGGHSSYRIAFTPAKGSVLGELRRSAHQGGGLRDLSGRIQCAAASGPSSAAWSCQPPSPRAPREPSTVTDSPSGHLRPLRTGPHRRPFPMRRAMTALAVMTLALLATAGPTLACGGLIGPNGAVNLLRTTTFAGYHEGVEHYVTSFEFAGGGGAFGSITPLPGVPSNVERGGDWTLQRLIRETDPPRESFLDSVFRAALPAA